MTWIITGILALIGSIAFALYRVYYHKPDGEIEDFPDPLPPDPPTDTTPTPNVPPEPISSPTDPLITFCTAIKDFEGANPANNNPGNCRCSPVGYLPKYGVVRCNPHGFAVFPTYELGWEYLQNLVLHRAQLHPEWTVLDFFNVYAPPSDSNPTEKYAKFVADRCGVSTSTTLANLFGLV